MKKPLSLIAALLLTIASSVSFAQDKSASASGGPTDPQIAAITVAANSVDINAGKLAQSKTHNKEVKAFAQQMVTDHTSVNKQATALVKKLGVKPEENPTSKSLEDEGKKNIAHLKTLKGAEFDKAYIEQEVTYHQQVLDTIDKTLLPSAQNAELKNLITTVRPVIAAHLEHAKQIQSTLSKS